MRDLGRDQHLKAVSCRRVPKEPAAPGVQTPAQLGELHQAILTLDPGAFLTHPPGAVCNGVIELKSKHSRSYHNMVLVQQVCPYGTGL